MARSRAASLPVSICATILLCSFSGVPVGAQVRDTVPADSVLYELEGVSVEAFRPLVTVGGTSGVEARVDSMGLAPSPSLEAVLREMPLLHIRMNSRGEAEVLARGSDSRQVAVLMDGIPLTLNWDARADVSTLPGAAPQEIRFFRGLSTMLHGPNTLGGVVELVTAGEHMTAPPDGNRRNGGSGWLHLPDLAVGRQRRRLVDPGRERLPRFARSAAGAGCVRAGSGLR
jgi:hypothetical protein